MAAFLTAILNVAEKAANLSRSIRSEKALFELLVEEKIGEQKNKRFVEDFKTLADVLIQEMIKHQLSEQFPGIAGKIYGEESNKFTNTLGESIEVTVKNNASETAQLLIRVLGDNERAASLLAQVVHSNVNLPVENFASDIDLDISSLGIWIDPIDSTAEYIKGLDNCFPTGGVYSHGLQCVTVLIGVYNLNTGLPCLGVVNQPFYIFDSNSKSWKGRHFWGIMGENSTLHSLNCRHLRIDGDSNISTVLSSSESDDIKTILSSIVPKSQVFYGSGAGYKAMCVVDGLVNIYALTKGSTFKWDSCAPHAVLRALGGGILDLRRALELLAQGADWDRVEGEAQTLYHQPLQDQQGMDRWCNRGGVLAYQDPAAARKVLQQFAKSGV